VRALILALVGLITVVAGGTAVLVVLKLKQTPDEPPTVAKADPPASKQKVKPTEKAAEKSPRDPDEPETAAKPEELPDRPEWSKKSKVTALDKGERLFLETGESGEKRVLFAAEVCTRQGVMLEVLCCKKNTKEHESILAVDLDARFIHAALLGAGAKAGKPVQFVNLQTQEAEYKPASGQKVKVEVCYRKDGKVITERAQEWILDQNTKKPMAHEWVFAGSRFVQNPDRPTDPPYYCANNGEVIAISNFVDSMLDLPVEVGRAERDLYFKAVEKKLPPFGSKVWVILTPVEEKKEEKK
jgi:hypothetical protein